MLSREADQEEARRAAASLHFPRRGTDAEVQDSLALLGSGGRWTRTLFLLGCWPGLLNAMHLAAYVFLAAEPEHWCAVTELPTWSEQERRNLSWPQEAASSPGGSSCWQVGWNFSQLASLPSLDAARTVIEQLPVPPLQPCREHRFAETSPGSSIVSEWSLVCERAALRPTAQVALAVGKILGALLFGCVSDRMGRKTSLVAASLLYVAAGPAAAFAFHYPVFLLFRAALGAAGSGTFYAAYTILAESAHPLKRPSLGILFNMSYPLGFLALSVTALLTPGWRPLQLAISLPALLLVLPCWFMPESPRWLLAQGRVREALHVLRQALPTEQNNSRRNSLLAHATEEPEQEHTACWAGTSTFFSRIADLLRTRELRWRLALLHAGWFACALTYHSLLLSGVSLLQQPHRYVALLGGVELLAYLLTPLLLRKVGRRAASSALLLAAATAMLVTIAVPTEFTGAMLCAAMASRLFVSAAYSVVALFSSELFPTVTRHTALGTCITVAQLGSIAAPYVVDLLGGVGGAHVPSALCGAVSVVASLLLLGLPETRNLPLCETVEEAVSGRCANCTPLQQPPPRRDSPAEPATESPA